MAARLSIEGRAIGYGSAARNEGSGMRDVGELDEAVRRLRAVVAGEAGLAGAALAGPEAVADGVPLAERLGRLEARLADTARALAALEQAVRALPAPDAETIAMRVRSELAHERARRRRAVYALLALVLLAGVAGWLWGDAVDVARILEVAGERAASLVEAARARLPQL